MNFIATNVTQLIGSDNNGILDSYIQWGFLIFIYLF